MEKATIKRKTRLTPDIYQYVIELEDGVFTGEVGQHTVLTGDKLDIAKPYSVISINKSEIVLMIRSYENGKVSKWIGEQTVGDEVKVSSKLTGNLTLQSESSDEIVLIATGTGITPLLGILHEYVRNGGRSATFILGEKTTEDLMYKSLLEQYSVMYDVDLTFVLSREESERYVQDYLRQDYQITSDKHYYSCGVPQSVVAVKQTLKEAGVPSENIITEGWEG